MRDNMDVAMKIRCSVRAKYLQRRLFRAHLEKADSDHSELLLHIDVRWLSSGKFQQRFREPCSGIKEFLLITKHAEWN